MRSRKRGIQPPATDGRTLASTQGQKIWIIKRDNQGVESLMIVCRLSVLARSPLPWTEDSAFRLYDYQGLYMQACWQVMGPSQWQSQMHVKCDEE